MGILDLSFAPDGAALRPRSTPWRPTRFTYLKLGKHTYAWSTVPGRASDHQDPDHGGASAGRGSGR